MAGKNAETTSDYSFETIDEGSRVRVQFEVGDEMVATFEGTETVDFPSGETGNYLTFRWISGSGEIEKGEPVAVSETYQLGKIQWEVGAVYRLYCRSTTPVRQGNDMLNFTVQKAK